MKTLYELIDSGNFTRGIYKLTESEAKLAISIVEKINAYDSFEPWDFMELEADKEMFYESKED